MPVSESVAFRCCIYSCIWENIVAKMLYMFTFCRLAKSASSTEFLKHKSFGRFVLQITPPQHWEAVASYIPLQILFECLGMSLSHNKVFITHTYSLMISLC